MSTNLVEIINVARADLPTGGFSNLSALDKAKRFPHFSKSDLSDWMKSKERTMVEEGELYDAGLFLMEILSRFYNYRE